MRLPSRNKALRYHVTAKDTLQRPRSPSSSLWSPLMDVLFPILIQLVLGLGLSDRNGPIYWVVLGRNAT